MYLLATLKLLDMYTVIEKLIKCMVNGENQVSHCWNKMLQSKKVERLE